ncbi:uncharacterized protein LOC109840305 isoform X1 [Asparagus officinalis]|uniref:uncharacterized protein LOC109840305 isoform X1 n=1 Tax=Asparagus officinalis TaxID=4686 RepID=UPI00098DEC73|nr:uncharacterized protein LOC109840305 isoform X1 [Asparagus officinalis]
MFPKDWTPPCGSCCTKKYATLMQIPWRVFCKKGCNADGDTMEDCIGECEEICYKDPVFKDQQWSAYIDRSPGDTNYSLECFHACVSGCGFKFEVPPEKTEQVQPNRPPPPVVTKSSPKLHPNQTPSTEDLPVLGFQDGSLFLFAPL